VTLRRKPGLHAVDDLAELRTGKGTPYAVFTPFYGAWLEQPRRTVLPPPDALPRYGRAR
jgi:deoxyribodipyrimidine photolyase